MVFFGQPRHEAADHASESNRLMTRPLVFLAVLSAFGGFLNMPYLSPQDNSHASEVDASHGEAVDDHAKLMPIIAKAN